MTSQGHNPCTTTSKTIAITLLHTQTKNKLPDPTTLVAISSNFHRQNYTIIEILKHDGRSVIIRE